MSLYIDIDTAPLEEAANRISDLADLDTRRILRTFDVDWYQRRRRLKYTDASQQTPFAPSSHGRRKPKSRRIMPDGKFGIDSGALFRDATAPATVDDISLEITLNQTYAPFVEKLFQEKSSFSEGVILAFDEDDERVFIKGFEDAIKSVLDEQTRKRSKNKRQQAAQNLNQARQITRRIIR